MSPARLFQELTGAVSAFLTSGAYGARLSVAGLTSLLCGVSPTAAALPTPNPTPALHSLGQVPLYFEANRGQADSRYSFLAHGRDHAIYLGPTEAVIALYSAAWASGKGGLRQTATTTSALVRVTLPGSSALSLSALEPLPGRVNYFLGSDRADWQTGVPTYRKVRCRDVYPGIDLIYYGSGEQLEYDFIVAPGADPEAIALRFEGADKVAIDARGDLVITVGRADLCQHKPVAFQTVAGERREVTASFRLGDAGTVMFQLGAYDQTQPLIIDPVLSYSTYFGGNPNDQGWAVAVDAAGATYIAGTTFSTRLLAPPTAGAFQTNFAGRGRVNGDVFVAKLNPAGTAYEYVTYLGGRNNDAAFGIAVDPGGNAYVTGYTDSVAIYSATNEVCETVCTNSVCGPMVCRTTVTRVRSLVPLTISTNTVIMTNLTETNIVVKVTETQLLGATLVSAGFPVANAFQPLNAGTNDPLVNLPFPDAFVTKLDPTGSALVYSTYLGGDGSEVGYGIAVDAAGRASVAGYTDSSVVYFATNEVCTTVCTNEFSTGVTNRLCGSTECLTNTTFVGSLVPYQVVTNFGDVVVVSNGVSVQSIDIVVTTTLLGATQLNVVGFPVANAIQPHNGGVMSFTEKGMLNYTASSDAFVATFSADGTSLAYSTYLGGLEDDLASGIAVDAAGNATVCGWTQSSDFPVAPLGGAFQTRLFGLQDAFVTRLDPSGNSLVYSTYLGASGGAFANRVAIDAAGSAYVTGSKSGNSFPSTPGALNRGGVFASVDAGATWTFSGQGLDHPLVQALAIAPTSPQPTIYAGTQRGVFRSVDGGASWIGSSGGFLFRNLNVNAIAVDPMTPSRLYAGTAGGIFASDDGGFFWIPSSDGLRDDNVRTIAITPGDSTVLYLGSQHGVFKSTNDWISWTASSVGLGNKRVNALVMDPVDPATLYAATEGGVFKSTNGAARWQPGSTGLTGTRVKALVIDRTDPTTLYAGTTRGFFKSVNAAANWVLLTNGLGRPFVTALAMDPLTPTTLYAGTTNGVFASYDAGQTWSVTTNGLSSRNVASLAIDALTFPPKLYAGMFGTNSFGGTNDVFLAKLAPDGLSLTYSVVFGGRKNEQGWDVAVDDANNAYVAGSTDSSNFPVVDVPGTNQFRLSGRSDAFVAQLNPDASAFGFSFYLGGSGNDYGYGLALDSAANVYVTGTTYSGRFPTNAAVQPRLAGGSDAFVTKVSNSPPLAAPLRARSQ